MIGMHPRSILCPSAHVGSNSESPLQAKLHGARPMRIQGVQKTSSGNAICSSFCLKTSGVQRAGIATNHVVARAAWIIRIIDTELRVVEDVESFDTKFDLAGLCHFEVFQQRQVEIHAIRIIEEVPAGIPKGESPGSYKLRRIAKQRTETLRIVKRSW